MLDSLIKLLFVLVPLMLSMVVYHNFDKEYVITDKISTKIKVNKKWQPFLVLGCAFALQIIVGIVGIYLIDIPTNVFFIFGGLMTGISTGFSNKLQNKIKDKEI
ncbi:hypothetical protein [Clostridium sp.]|uniref:hypothetical protein n=1 Tax=Clostridium sp. TaxID=1506 RepID=UPI003216EBAC